MKQSFIARQRERILRVPAPSSPPLTTPADIPLHSIASLLRENPRYVRVDILSAMNLISPTLGDGDCFYHTLCQGLTALNYTPIYTPATLRAAVTTEMSNNPRRYPPPHNFTRSQYIKCLPLPERQQLPPSYAPTQEDYYRYAATPRMYADQRHRVAFQHHLFPDVRIIVWAPFDYPLSSLEVTHPRLYT